MHPPAEGGNNLRTLGEVAAAGGAKGAHSLGTPADDGTAGAAKGADNPDTPGARHPSDDVDDVALHYDEDPAYRAAVDRLGRQHGRRRTWHAVNVLDELGAAALEAARARSTAPARRDGLDLIDATWEVGLARQQAVMALELLATAGGPGGGADDMASARAAALERVAVLADLRATEVALVERLRRRHRARRASVGQVVAIPTADRAGLEDRLADALEELGRDVLASALPQSVLDAAGEAAAHFLCAVLEVAE